MLSVAIIGAGPGGLVAAKTLLHSYPKGTFEVTVFEKTASVGGLWAVEAEAPTFINPSMRANLTQFTVAFSGLSWDSVGIVQGDGNAANGQYGNAAHSMYVPVYPIAWQVNRYLEKYHEKFIPNGVVCFNTCVRSAERFHGDGSIKWKIRFGPTSSEGQADLERIFDHMIVASGMYSQPSMIQCQVTNNISDPTSVQNLHSSQFRKLSDLSSEGAQLEGKVLVVGGSHSGSDIATLVAYQISNAKYSSSGTVNDSPELVLVIPRPLYALPTFVPAPGDEGGFLPLDLLLYNLDRRPAASLSFTYGQLTAEKAEGLRKFVQSLLLGECPDREPSTKDDEEVVPPFVTVSDSFSSYVREGAITQRFGRLASLVQQGESGLMRATIDNGSGTMKIEDVAAVIHATGYTTSASLEFLSDEIKSQLGFDPAISQLPLLLDTDFLTCTAALKDMGCIGFLAGPYWGVMETQARAIARRWAKASKSTTVDDGQQNLWPDILSCMQEFRHRISTKEKPVPQSLFGDYVGFMEQASRVLDLTRLDLHCNESKGPICPARYADAGTDKDESLKTMIALQRILERATNEGAFVAKAVFRALHGTWNARLCPCPSDKNEPRSPQHHISVFHPREPTDPAFDFEYLRIDSSNTATTTTTTPVYRYAEATDSLSIWTTQQADQRSVAQRAYTLEFESRARPGRRPSPQQKKKAWHAKVVRPSPIKGDSKGEEEEEEEEYEFHFQGVELQQFSIWTAKGGEEAEMAVEYLR